MTNDKCRNCGGDSGIHHYQTEQCPVGGVEAPMGREQEWKTSTFAPVIHPPSQTNGNDMAYPVDAGEGNFASGLTKREYFAAMVMQGYAATEGNGAHLTANANLAVQQADALIEALNR